MCSLHSSSMRQARLRAFSFPGREAAGRRDLPCVHQRPAEHLHLSRGCEPHLAQSWPQPFQQRGAARFIVLEDAGVAVSLGGEQHSEFAGGQRQTWDDELQDSVFPDRVVADTTRASVPPESWLDSVRPQSRSSASTMAGSR
ncbi:hypothetical protein BHS07_37740 [Myxococcus xanthus]|nr:hypothetical protein BHS07_37740 [Myxococcus xanthus]